MAVYLQAHLLHPLPLSRPFRATDGCSMQCTLTPSVPAVVHTGHPPSMPNTARLTPPNQITSFHLWNLTLLPPPKKSSLHHTLYPILIFVCLPTWYSYLLIDLSGLLSVSKTRWRPPLWTFYLHHQAQSLAEGVLSEHLWLVRWTPWSCICLAPNHTHMAPEPLTGRCNHAVNAHLQ